MKKNLLYTIVICFSLFVSILSFSPGNDNTNLVANVLSLTNQFRESQGLPVLIMKQQLNALAQKHSADMASGRVSFGHAGFGERAAEAMSEIKGLHSFAENVAFGATSANEVVTLWKNSPGHRRNMLGPYKYIGIGTAKDSKGQIYYTEVFGG
ncbi:MAG TPA: CAP domain-containing protein [Hanamia sp.]|nr:CAP domain-containing protein [Hanamia sp.]